MGRGKIVQRERNALREKRFKRERERERNALRERERNPLRGNF